MNRVLILYGSTDGQTGKIADAMHETLHRAGVDCNVVEAGTLAPNVAEYSAIIIAASVHTGRYQRSVENWVRANATALNDKPTAFVSVCLAILQQSDPKVMAELDAIVRRFTSTTGWNPGIVKQVAGALLYTRYNFFKRWIMKRIVAKAGGATDTSRDYEYTDWTDVRRFTEEFVRRIPAAA